jgi:hypothetical protein
MKKEQTETLQRRELVKPNVASERLVHEVESLCEGFTCDGFEGSPAGDAGSEHDILF